MYCREVLHPNSQLREAGISRELETGCCEGGDHGKESVGVGGMRRCVWARSWRWSRLRSSLALVGLTGCGVTLVSGLCTWIDGVLFAKMRKTGK